MKTKFLFPVLLGLLATAHAHVTLEQASAPAGSYYKAVLRVGHGCAGLPTTALRVQLPAGFKGAKPMPKSGWTLSTRSEKLAQPYISHGKTVSEDVSEITWTANNHEAWLADAHYDEFVLRGQLPEQAGALWFKVLQSCEAGDKSGSNDWSQIPSSGMSTQGLKTPAALLQVMPAASAVNSPTSAGHQH